MASPPAGEGVRLWNAPDSRSRRKKSSPDGSRVGSLDHGVSRFFWLFWYQVKLDPDLCELRAHALVSVAHVRQVCLRERDDLGEARELRAERGELLANGAVVLER